MTVVLDASVLVDHLCGDAAARRVLAIAADRGRLLAASVVTKVEVLAAVRPANEAGTRQLLDVLTWIPVDDAIADRAGTLANEFAPAHPDVDRFGCIVAATVEHLDAELWTRTLSRFPMLPRLTAPY